MVQEQHQWYSFQLWSGYIKWMKLERYSTTQSDEISLTTKSLGDSQPVGAILAIHSSLIGERWETHQPKEMSKEMVE